MCTIERAREALFRSFAAVTLRDLDARGDMLTRFESKYILDAGRVGQLLAEASGGFDVLEIDGRRDFRYDTCYFDDEHCSTYHAHRQGRRRRFKVRTRRYADTGLCYAEIKLRWVRGLTVKRRSLCPGDCHRALTGRAREDLRSAHREFFGLELQTALQPTVDVQYRRVTLAARGEPTRVTIDWDVAFSGAGRSTWHNARGVVIVEVKSALRRNCTRDLFSSLGQHPVKRMSKYCVGMAVTGRAQKINPFLRVLRRLGLETDRSAVPVAAVDRERA